MCNYCLFCLDELGVVRSIEVISAESDNAAKRLAIKTMETRKEFSEVDLWGEGRRIYLVRRLGASLLEEHNE